MSMRFTYPSHAANKKAETKSGGYAPKNRAAKPALRFRSRESIPDSQALSFCQALCHARTRRNPLLYPKRQRLSALEKSPKRLDRHHDF